MMCEYFYCLPATQVHEANKVKFSWLSDSLGLPGKRKFGKLEMGEKHSCGNTFKQVMFQKPKENSTKEKSAFVDLVY